jgi:hypothetical protein
MTFSCPTYRPSGRSTRGRPWLIVGHARGSLQQLRQLRDVRRDPPRLVDRQGTRPDALRRFVAVGEGDGHAARIPSRATRRSCARSSREAGSDRGALPGLSSTVTKRRTSPVKRCQHAAAAATQRPAIIRVREPPKPSRPPGGRFRFDRPGGVLPHVGSSHAIAAADLAYPSTGRDLHRWRSGGIDCS